MYHMHIPPTEVDRMPVFERRWYIDRFVEQKQKENEAIERERRKASAKR